MAKPKTAAERLQAGLDSLKAAEAQELEEIHKEASKYCATISDFMGSTLPEERQRLEHEFKQMFLREQPASIKDKPAVFWARGLKMLATRITKLQDEKASLQARITKMDEERNATQRVHDAYKQGVRDAGGGDEHARRGWYPLTPGIRW